MINLKSGNDLRKIRNELGIKVDEIADHLFLTSRAIYMWEKFDDLNAKISKKKLDALHHYLEIRRQEKLNDEN